MMGWQWHQLDHMQIICTTLQTEPRQYPITQFFMGQMLFLTRNQQCQSTEGRSLIQKPIKNVTKIGKNQT